MNEGSPFKRTLKARQPLTSLVHLTSPRDSKTNSGLKTLGNRAAIARVWRGRHLNRDPAISGGGSSEYRPTGNTTNAKETKRGEGGVAPRAGGGRRDTTHTPPVTPHNVTPPGDAASARPQGVWQDRMSKRAASHTHTTKEENSGAGQGKERGKGRPAQWCWRGEKRGARRRRGGGGKDHDDRRWRWRFEEEKRRRGRLGQQQRQHHRPGGPVLVLLLGRPRRNGGNGNARGRGSAHTRGSIVTTFLLFVAVPLGVRRPQREVVSEELHYECAILVAVLI